MKPQIKSIRLVRQTDTDPNLSWVGEYGFISAASVGRYQTTVLY